MKQGRFYLAAAILLLASGCEKEDEENMYCTPKVGHFWGVFYEI